MSDVFLPPKSMWRLRGNDPLGCQWKVTARYGVCYKDDVYLDCVRVVCFGRSHRMTRHFVITEFLRLFVMVGPAHLLPKPILEEST